MCVSIISCNCPMCSHDLPISHDPMIPAYAPCSTSIHAPDFRAQDGDEKARLQASQDRGTMQYFGERALLKNNEPRAATVKVTSKDAKALEPWSYVN